MDKELLAIKLDGVVQALREAVITTISVETVDPGGACWNYHEQRAWEIVREKLAELVRKEETLEVAAQICDNYDDWAPQWGEYRNMAVAQQAATDCAKKIRELIGK